MGGMGGSSNEDIHVEKVAGWEDSTCVGWAFFTDAGRTCHLDANQEDQHPGVADRISGLLTHK